MTQSKILNRRKFNIQSTAAFTALGLSSCQSSVFAATKKWKPKYILGSCMYGTTKLKEILPQVFEIGAAAIDIWPKVHGDQREQIDAMGEDKFLAMLREHNCQLGCLTQYKLGPFGLKDEMKFAKKMGCSTIVTGGSGPKKLSGNELKNAVKNFIEKLKPHTELAAKNGVTIAIENHSNNLIQSPDSLKWLAELGPKNLGIALAPYHLPQDEKLLSGLIENLGEKMAMFYAWQHGMGCMNKLPKEQELLQMPGRGKLNFQPLIESLKKIDYNGWFEIFMHPVPRGIPILETTQKVNAEINRSRKYLEKFL